MAWGVWSRAKYGLLSDRYRDTPATLRGLFHAMEALERVFWRWLWLRAVRPHLRPRTYAREWYRDLIDFRAPPVIHAFTWNCHDEGDYFVGQFRNSFAVPTAYDNLCCFDGRTREECQRNMEEFVADFAKDAGTYDRKGYRIEWHDFNPDLEPTAPISESESSVP